MRKNGAKPRLIKAFFNQLENHHYTSISVTDLINEAGCSRTTFYRHYTDVIDMYNKICEEIVDSLNEELALCLAGEKKELYEIFDNYCGKLESQKKYISILCGRNGSRTFFEIGIKKAFARIDTFTSILNTEEKFILRFVVLSLISTYVKALMDSSEFDKKYFEICRGILVSIGKEGVFLGGND